MVYLVCLVVWDACVIEVYVRIIDCERRVFDSLWKIWIIFAEAIGLTNANIIVRGLLQKNLINLEKCFFLSVLAIWPEIAVVIGGVRSTFTFFSLHVYTIAYPYVRNNRRETK